MKYQMTCGYCDNKEILEFYGTPKKEWFNCKVCKETKNLKITEVKTGNVFGYSETDKKPDAYFESKDDNDDSWGNWPE